MSEGMAVPSWVGEAKDQMFREHGSTDYSNAKVDVRDLPVVENFSNLFAEYELKGDGLLVHLFPRGGEEDRFWPSRVDETSGYIPGRLEEVVDFASFPNDIVNRIKSAADVVWQGSVAIDRASILRYGPGDDVGTAQPSAIDLGAYAVQFQDATTSVKLVGVDKFMDTFCEALDGMLEA